MKVIDLINLLKDFNPDAEVVIHRDNINYGFGIIKSVKVGIYEATDYGGDFLPYEDLIVNPAQIKSICLYPEDCENAAKEQEDHG